MNVTSSVDSTAKTGSSVLDLRKCYYVDTDKWTTELTQNLMDWSDNVNLKPLVTYSAADMGGYAGIAGMVKFTETYSSGGSSGCSAGGLSGLMFIIALIPFCKSKFR